MLLVDDCDDRAINLRRLFAVVIFRFIVSRELIRQYSALLYTSATTQPGKIRRGGTHGNTGIGTWNFGIGGF
jgi:hypothetical protein